MRAGRNGRKANGRGLGWEGQNRTKWNETEKKEEQNTEKNEDSHAKLAVTNTRAKPPKPFAKGAPGMRQLARRMGAWAGCKSRVRGDGVESWSKGVGRGLLECRHGWNPGNEGGLRGGSI